MDAMGVEAPRTHRLSNPTATRARHALRILFRAGTPPGFSALFRLDDGMMQYTIAVEPRTV